MEKKKAPGGLVDEVEAYVRKLPWKERVKVAGKFNEYDSWPEELPMKPEGWDNMSRDEKWDITLPICDRLYYVVSPKASCRYWYTQIRGYSEKEFREFWRDRYKGGAEEPNYMIWAYIMGICTGIQVALMIVRIVLRIKGII